MKFKDVIFLILLFFITMALVLFMLSMSLSMK